MRCTNTAARGSTPARCRDSCSDKRARHAQSHPGAQSHRERAHACDYPWPSLAVARGRSWELAEAHRIGASWSMPRTRSPACLSVSAQSADFVLSPQPSRCSKNTSSSTSRQPPATARSASQLEAELTVPGPGGALAVTETLTVPRSTATTRSYSDTMMTAAAAARRLEGQSRFSRSRNRRFSRSRNQYDTQPSTALSGCTQPDSDPKHAAAGASTTRTLPRLISESPAPTPLHTPIGPRP
jgi:hypothetical protein